MDTVTQRLDRLERENRWWKVLGIVSAAVLGLVVLTGATGSKVWDEVRAKKFIVVDEEGNTRGSMGLESYRPLGSRTEKSDTVLRLFGEDKQGGFKIIVFRGGGGVLGFYNKDNKMQILLNLERIGLDTFPRLTLRGQNGAEAELSLFRGSPSLTIKDKNGAKAVLGHTELEVTRTGEVRKRPASSLVLLNKDGKVIWSAP